MTKVVKCPDCAKLRDDSAEEVIIIPDDASVGDIVECQICGAELEIISLDPLQVVLIEEEK